MIQLKPIRSEKIWGYEDWIASTHSDGAQADFAQAAGDYPLLVKIIQANDTLSVQVHPDDKTAVALEGSGALGKTECWYVLEAAPDAQLVYGLKKNCTTDELRAAIQDNTLESKLNIVRVQKGDFIFIPAGSVHAIGGGLRLLEVQQNCNITYRLYDWGRPRELHVEKGLQSVQHADRAPIAPMQDEFSCAYFTLQKVAVHGTHTWRTSHGDSDKNTGAQWQLVFVADGNGTITATGTDDTHTAFDFHTEQIFAVAPDESVTVTGNCEIIRIIPRRETLRL